MAEQSLIVEDQILQIPTLDRHHDDAMNGIDRRDDPIGTRLQMQRIFGADARTHATAETNLRVEFGEFHLRMMRIVGRDQRHRFDGTDADAFAAAVALIGLNARQEIGGVYRIQQAEFARGDHRFTATAAAITNEVHAFAHVFAELH